MKGFDLIAGRDHRSPKFQQRHYEALAKVFANTRSRDALTLLYSLADMLANDNPNFNRERFLTAAGDQE